MLALKAPEYYTRAVPSRMGFFPFHESPGPLSPKPYTHARAVWRRVVLLACQVLRYNQSRAYVVHYDYLESAEGHDFKSEGLGTNRFATVSVAERVFS